MHRFGRARGFGLIELAIWAGIVGAVGLFAWGAWHGFTAWVSAGPVEEQRKADQKVINTANDERDKYKADAAEADKRANNAKTDLGTCKQAAGEQSDGVNKMKARAIAAEASIRAMKAAGAARENEQQGRLTEYKKLATENAGAALSCTDELAKLDKFLRDRARANKAAEDAKAKAGAQK